MKQVRHNGFPFLYESYDQMKSKIRDIVWHVAATTDVDVHIKINTTDIKFAKTLNPAKQSTFFFFKLKK